MAKAEIRIMARWLDDGYLEVLSIKSDKLKKPPIRTEESRCGEGAGRPNPLGLVRLRVFKSFT